MHVKFKVIQTSLYSSVEISLAKFTTVLELHLSSSNLVQMSIFSEFKTVQDSSVSFVISITVQDSSVSSVISICFYLNSVWRSYSRRHPYPYLQCIQLRCKTCTFIMDILRCYLILHYPGLQGSKLLLKSTSPFRIVSSPDQWCRNIYRKSCGSRA